MARDRIRIYGSNGEIRYDSGQRDAEGTDDAIRAQFDSGLLWYHNPDEGILRCQTKARTSMPEQFVVDFEANRSSRSSPVEAFRAALEDTFEELDWEYIPSNRDSDIQIVMEQMGQVGAKQPPAYEEDLLKRLIGRGTGVTFAVPSKKEAVAVAEYFRSLSSEISIAISQSGRTDAIPNADVVLVPSDDYAEITGIDGTDAALREVETDAYVDSVIATVERAVDPAKAGTASQIATLLNRSGLRKQNITAVPNKRNKQQSRQAFVWPFLVSSILVFAGLFVFLTEPARLVTGLVGAVRSGLVINFIVRDSPPIPSWGILLVIAISYGVTAVLLWMMGILRLPSTGRSSSSGKGSDNLSKELLKEASSVSAEHNSEYINWGEVTRRLHRQYPQVLVKPTSSYDRRLYVSGGLGVAVGVVVGGVTGAGLAFAYDWLSQRPLAVLNAIWAAGFIVPIGLCLYVSFRVFKSVLSGRSSRGRSSRGRRSRGPGRLLLLILLGVILLSVIVSAVMYLYLG